MSRDAGRSLLALGVLCACLSACACLPREQTTAAAKVDELVTHVEFMAAPERGGRRPRSPASADVRRYLIERFTDYGLVPWEGTGSFEQSFIIGTNVIAVLPGSDPAVADEFVVLSAHYDHTGVHHGKLHPGACDNASGVAVMLEAAERLALAAPRPRRSVVFAAFDCEETGLLGSFAFTARADFDPDRLAGVVNLDMLGRDFLDAVDSTLLAFGTEQFPQLRKTVMQAGEEAGLRVLPLGRDLVGPRSDHAPFELYDAPVVFLTCGQYSDYHKPTDTPDKLDYEDLRRSVDLVADTVRSLTDAEEVESPVTLATGDRGELEAVRTLITEITTAPERGVSVSKELTDARREALAKLGERAGELLAAETYTARDRQAFAADLAEAIVPVLVGGSVGQKQLGSLMMLRDLYRRAPRLLLEGRRDLMAHIAQHRPGVFRGAPRFSYADAELSEQTVVLQRVGEDAAGDGGDGSDGGDRWRLSVMVPYVSGHVDIGWFGQHKKKISVKVPVGGDCTGTLAELTDYTLLCWGNSSGKPPANRAWAYVLRQVTGEDHGQRYEDWRNWWLAARENDRGATAASADASLSPGEAWVAGLLDSRNPAVLEEAITAALAWHPDRLRAKVAALVGDATVPAPLRANAMAAVRADDGPAALATLRALLADETPADHRALNPVHDPTYPFYHDALSRQVRQRHAESDKPAVTLAQSAREHLERLGLAEMSAAEPTRRAAR